MHVPKPQVKLDFNVGTLLAIFLAIIGGLYKFATLENRVDTIDQRGLARIPVTDKNFADINAILRSQSDLPFRVAAVETEQKNLNARIDRVAEIMLNGQDLSRKDLAAAVESIKKDVSAVGTKVEVLSAKFEDVQRRGRADPPTQ